MSLVKAKKVLKQKTLQVCNLFPYEQVYPAHSLQATSLKTLQPKHSYTQKAFDFKCQSYIMHKRLYD